MDTAYYENQFFVVLEDQPGTLFGASLSCLSRRQGASAFIQTYAPLLKALEPDVAAAYFASWFGGVCAAFQYSLWHDSFIPDFSLDNMEVQIYDSGRRIALAFRMKEWRGEPLTWPNRNDRSKEAMIQFYGQQVKPLLESLAGTVSISSGILWATMITRMHYAMDRWYKEAHSEESLVRLKQDMDTLLHGLDPALFGRSRSPFDIRFRMMENPRVPGEQMRIKPVCCLAYKTDTDHGYCYTCPRLTEAEREEKVQRIKMEAGHG
ncbi:(2Fe-2S)-binding protein [Paenibacillus sp. OAS669]|uniref:(2Fe-2S)-binding protein n=1 Tax=Paenibacillus sp. OAS669 TaxID=2663821 RepID=UPI0017892EE0|nr:(2Fe-2S)-binding protein [Paenibacillus sp. OAS669]MBE1446508.1 ferric iron reductase protein FhuF [Paenibacillus sp. OAS669]